MRQKAFATTAALLALTIALGCQTATSPPPAESSPAAAATPVPTPAATAAATAPDHIKLQHILIAFAGKVRGKNVTRTQEEARVLANEVLARAKKGEDFDALVRTYTDDRAPGIYALSNSGVAPGEGEFSRDRMVPAFGNVGFSLAPGEIGMAEYDPAASPYGWHIIKRLE